MRVGARAAAGLLVTLALAGCSVGTKTSTTPATTTAATTEGPATTTDPTGTGTTGTAPAGTGSAPAATGTATSPGIATGTASGSDGHAGKGHKGNGLPAAPSGLSQTAGYATYERCQGTCTGAVPATLRRPLKLPSADGGPCPITIKAQPASPRELAAGLGFHSVSGSEWPIAGVTWTVPGAYTGPLLIRGAMIGGGGLGFGTGAVPYDELQLLDAGQGAPRVAGGGRAWITYTRVRSGGCYAYQVDGTSFSEVVVFRAVT